MKVRALRREGRRKKESGCEIGSVVVVVVIMRMIMMIVIMVTMIYADHVNHDAKHEVRCEMGSLVVVVVVIRMIMTHGMRQVAKWKPFISSGPGGRWDPWIRRSGGLLINPINLQNPSDQFARFMS